MQNEKSEQSMSFLSYLTNTKTNNCIYTTNGMKENLLVVNNDDGQLLRKHSASLDQKFIQQIDKSEIKLEKKESKKKRNSSNKTNKSGKNINFSENSCNNINFNLKKKKSVSLEKKVLIAFQEIEKNNSNKLEKNSSTNSLLEKSNFENYKKTIFNHFNSKKNNNSKDKNINFSIKEEKEELREKKNRKFADYIKESCKY